MVNFHDQQQNYDIIAKNRESSSKFLDQQLLFKSCYVTCIHLLVQEIDPPWFVNEFFSNQIIKFLLILKFLYQIVINAYIAQRLKPSLAYFVV